MTARPVTARPASPRDPGLRPVSIVLEYFHPWTNSAGLFVASREGWFAEAGLDVDLRTVDPSRGDSLAYLQRGEVDLAVFPSNRLLVRRERGERLTGVAAVNHRGLETILTVRSTGITRPRELEGRRLALNPTPRGLAMVRHLVEADGGDLAKVELVDSGHRELLADDVAAGAADATFGNYWAWDALIGAVPAEERVVWPVDTIGAPTYHSYLLGARDELLEAEPDLVRTLLAVVDRGYREAVARPELALRAFETFIPYFPRALLARSLELISTTWLHEGRWGGQREELLAPYARFLTEHGVLRDPEVWRAATSNAYLPAGAEVTS